VRISNVGRRCGIIIVSTKPITFEMGI